MDEQSQITAPRAKGVPKANHSSLTAVTGTAVPVPTLTPAAFADPTLQEASASVAVVQGVLRSGPSDLFSILARYPRDTMLTVYGVTTNSPPNRQWARVKGSDGQTGWMQVEETTIKPDGLSIITPKEGIEAYRISGKVMDTEGVPVDGVDVAVIAQNDSEQRLDTHSDSSGVFTAYVPLELSSVAWSVQIVGVVCTSRIMRTRWGTCQFNNIIELAPHALGVARLPQSEELVFRYEPVHSAIAGSVLDAGGQPLKDMRVFAVREDGAYSYGETDVAGGFSLPASNGSWIVYTVTFDPRREGKRVEVTIQNDAPVRIDLQPPD